MEAIVRANEADARARGVQLSDVRVHERTSLTLRLFDRGDYYLAVKDSALFIAKRLYHSESVLKFSDIESESVPVLSVSRKLFASVVQRVLVQELGTVQVFAKGSGQQDSGWKLARTGSPGAVQAFRAELEALGNDQGAFQALDACLCAVFIQGDQAGVALCNSSFGSFGAAYVPLLQVSGLLAQEGVRQCYISSSSAASDRHSAESLSRVLRDNSLVVHHEQGGSRPDAPGMLAELSRLFGLDSQAALDPALSQTLASYPIANRAVAILVSKLDAMSEESGRPQRFRPISINPIDSMYISPATFRALSLFPEASNAARGGAKKQVCSSLYGLLAGQCLTTAGKRLLAKWIRRPSCDAAQITRRHTAVNFFLQDIESRQTLNDQVLNALPDIERLALRLENASVSGLSKDGASSSGALFKGREILSVLVSLYKGLCQLRKAVPVLQKDQSNAAAADRNDCGSSVKWIVDQFAVTQTLGRLESFEAKVERLVDSAQLRLLEGRGGSGRHYEARVSPNCAPELLALSTEIKTLDASIAQEAARFAQQCGKGVIDSIRFRAHGGTDQSLAALDDSGEEVDANDDVVVSKRAQSHAAAKPAGSGKRKRARKAVILHLESSHVHGTTFRLTKADYETVVTCGSSKRSGSTATKMGVQVVTREKSGVRFRTPQLKNLYDQHSKSLKRYRDTEIDILRDALGGLQEHVKDIRLLGSFAALLDVIVGLARTAELFDYVQPTVTALGSGPLVLSGARHPLVERLLPPGGFVPNDISLRCSGTEQKEECASVAVITGPNMGGKSVLSKMIAMCVIMSQIGSFVPAAAARLPLCDSVLARVGASDDISSGASTFMVEMRDMASIVSRAGRGALVVVDEIGRGTSVTDGFGLAWALTKHLCSNAKCLALVATHFFELNELDKLRDGQNCPLVRNLHMAAQKVDDDVIMLYSAQPGSTNKSYGVSIAKMANFPDKVVKDAAKELDKMERLRDLSST